MPKINAATVAEHHSNQRDALLQAAVEILTAQGAAAVTPAAVGARAGLARSSVYLYFPSSAALIATLVEEAFTRWNAVVGEALERAKTPRRRIETYVRATIGLAATGEHRAATALMNATLPDPCRARLRELHTEVDAPLAAAVREAGATQPELTSRLIGGLLQAGMAAVEDGSDPETVAERTVALTLGAIPRRRPEAPDAA
jgi:AcrR family transcriptional regulator